MEFKKSTGSIQIALFQIIGAVAAIFGQFLAAILAFSLALTKVYVAEVSFNAADNSSSHGLCEKELDGFACWWSSTRFLTWSLMGIAELSPLNSSDTTSDVLAELLYGIFLIMGVVMLMNMMIALLSNTYQQVQDNAFYEWSYRKATTIRTYNNYHPVPVPFNILSLCYVLLRYICKNIKRKCICCKKNKGQLSFKVESTTYDPQRAPPENMFFDCLIIDLQNHYFSVYGYTFPMGESNKMDQVLKETEGSHRLIGHIANRVFRYDWKEEQELRSHGSSDWDTKGIDINGQRLSYNSCDCMECALVIDDRDRPDKHGARYCTPLSRDMPGFEVLIQENGERRFIAIGVVTESYELHKFPGWEGNTAGYHIDDGKIFDRNNPKLGRECEDAMAYRGDLIGCKILYDKPTIDADGASLPVSFTLNGRVIGEGSIATERSSAKFYAFIGIGWENINLVFRVFVSQTSPTDAAASDGYPFFAGITKKYLTSTNNTKKYLTRTSITKKHLTRTSITKKYLTNQLLENIAKHLEQVSNQLHDDLSIQIQQNSNLLQGDISKHLEQVSNQLHDDLSIQIQQNSNLLQGDISKHIEQVSNQLHQGLLSVQIAQISNQLHDIAQRQSDLENKVSVIYDHYLQKT
ncbi:hypothetical protein QZH41_018382 [Actinostola sp. cb2023]|nr:hypothetical protein QZH41_018382 [Actinostola sp. cb2023]